MRSNQARDSGAGRSVTTKQVGDEGEARALDHLLATGARLVARNYRTPGRGGGEVDLIVREPDGTLVFVEVRSRADVRHGGAAASVTPVKRRRLILAARHYLMRLASCPPCRFDVIALDADAVTHIRGAFDADG